MTKEEAKKALKAGHKITHRFFSDVEFVHLHNGKFKDERGVWLDYSDFWKQRQNEKWLNGWSVCKSVAAIKNGSFFGEIKMHTFTVADFKVEELKQFKDNEGNIITFAVKNDHFYIL